MSIDTIGDFLTIIRNGLMCSKPYIVAPHSSVKAAIAAILKEEGFIKDAVVVEHEGRKKLKVLFKYVEGESVIHELTRVSTPGRRAYTGSSTIRPVIGGLGISILTTNRGIMSNKKAQELAVGGEVICTVW